MAFGDNASQVEIAQVRGIGHVDQQVSGLGVCVNALVHLRNVGSGDDHVLPIEVCFAVFALGVEHLGVFVHQRFDLWVGPRRYHLHVRTRTAFEHKSKLLQAHLTSAHNQHVEGMDFQEDGVQFVGFS